MIIGVMIGAVTTILAAVEALYRFGRMMRVPPSTPNDEAGIKPASQPSTPNDE